jgi:hypothetical protein
MPKTRVENDKPTKVTMWGRVKKKGKTRPRNPCRKPDIDTDTYGPE